jgi:DNA-binding transcriptional ArsR family regulator
MDALAAVGTPRRREILRLVWSQERAAGEIHRALPDFTFGALSQHLKLLKDAGVVSCRAEGRNRLYLARRDALGELADYLEKTWDDALYRLKLAAELEDGRRGPRGSGRRRRGERAEGKRRRGRR